MRPATRRPTRWRPPTRWPSRSRHRPPNPHRCPSPNRSTTSARTSPRPTAPRNRSTRCSTTWGDRPPMSTTPTEAPPASGVEAAVPQLVAILQKLERPDLVQRATAAAARLKRPATIVCVVGEFKQGKSSLVNGLLGARRLPGRRRPRHRRPSPSCATARSRRAVVPAPGRRRGRWPSAVAVDEPRRVGHRSRATPATRSGVERVEIAVPSADPRARGWSSSTRPAWAGSAPATRPRRSRSCPSPTGCCSCPTRRPS